MPTAIADNEFMLRCSCGDRVEHVAWLVHEQDETYGDDWYLITSLDGRFGFFRRLLVAFYYAFRPKSFRYCGYAELVLKDDDVERLAEFICRRREIVIDAAGIVTWRASIEAPLSAAHGNSAEHAPMAKP